jgi:predicted nucleotidyltransferase component of viral defense system
MITKNPMQLKAFIKNKAAEKKISAQLVMQNYMLERLLERLSLSEYKYNFIVKGGFLISSIVGLDTRTTMDLDTTIKGFTLTHDSIRKIFNEICSIEVSDDIKFEITNISDIRETDDYPGIRVSMKGNYTPISVPLTVDVTTGDIITPREIEYSIPLLFDERKIEVLAYNLETILAEKIETVLSRSTANTRPRDFYDIHVLYALYSENIDYRTLKQALERTSEKRGSLHIFEAYKEIVSEIFSNEQMNFLWRKYQRDYDYAKDFSFEEVCNTVITIMEKLKENM